MERAKRRDLEPVVRRMIVGLKAGRSGPSGNEISNIVYVRGGCGVASSVPSTVPVISGNA